MFKETVALCHNASSGFGGPVERVCMSVPFHHKSHQALCQLIAVREVADLKPFVLENTEPLLDLVHPGAMDGQNLADKTRMGCQPSLNLLASMDASVIKHEEHALHSAGISRSSLASKVMNSAWRFRRALRTVTFPVRVSQAANRCRAPAR
jgi:hypothetical protein